jgi:hypothetical protein
MSTIRQIQANQGNAAHSTGPRSVEGKAIVSSNALKSGIDARTLVIPGESPLAFEILKDEYHHRWCPTTPEQRALVDALIAAEWLNRRYLRLETQLWQNGIPSDDGAQPGLELARAFQSGGTLFDRVNRHKNAARRNFHTALRDLQRLKKEELQSASPALEPANPAPIPPPPPQPVDPASTSIPSGFVPHKYPPLGTGTAHTTHPPPAPSPLRHGPILRTAPPPSSLQLNSVPTPEESK